MRSQSSRKKSCVLPHVARADRRLSVFSNLTLTFKWAAEDQQVRSEELRWQQFNLAIDALEKAEADDRRKTERQWLQERSDLIRMVGNLKALVERECHFMVHIDEPSKRQSVMFESTVAFYAIRNQMMQAYVVMLDKKTPHLCPGAKLSKAEIALAMRQLPTDQVRASSASKFAMRRISMMNTLTEARERRDQSRGVGPKREASYVAVSERRADASLVNKSPRQCKANPEAMATFGIFQQRCVRFNEDSVVGVKRVSLK